MSYKIFEELEGSVIDWGIDKGILTLTDEDCTTERKLKQFSKTEEEVQELHDAILDHSSCRETSFVTSRIARCSFKFCQLYKAKFFGAKAKNADFSKAKLVQAQLNRLKGDNIKFYEECVFLVWGYTF